MFVDALLVLVALGLLVAGAEGLVRGSAALAARAGLPPLVIGLTIVAFGTSAPELVVSIEAVRAGQADLALGNVLGSNIFNVAVILGLAALLHPLAVAPRIARVDAPVALGAALVVVLLAANGHLGPLEGTALLAALGIWIAASVHAGRRAVGAGGAEADAGTPPQRHWALDVLFTGGGLGLLVWGSEILVVNAVDLARGFGVDEAVIGLTIVAAGTSAPELATSVVAALRRQADIAVANVVGSNVFNLLGILGFGALAGDLRPRDIGWVDFGTLLAVSALLVVFGLLRGRVGRAEGLLLLAGYGAWLAWLWP